MTTIYIELPGTGEEHALAELLSDGDELDARYAS